MKRSHQILIVASAILTVTLLKVVNAETSETKTESASAGEKSVGWYIANPKEAREQNKECHDNPPLQATTNCVNSLQALQLSFAGGPGRR